MKSQREIYEALLAGKVLRYGSVLVRINSAGKTESKHLSYESWDEKSYSFCDPSAVEIYTPPRIPMTLVEIVDKEEK